MTFSVREGYRQRKRDSDVLRDWEMFERSNEESVFIVLRRVDVLFRNSCLTARSLH